MESIVFLSGGREPPGTIIRERKQELYFHLSAAGIHKRLSESMTTFLHQTIVAHVFKRLSDCVGESHPSEVFFSPMWVRTVRNTIRQPDIAYIQSQRIPNRDQPSNGADLVVEVVAESREDRERDYNRKREEYAATGIPEYWIVDPQTASITVLKLVSDAYQLHGKFRRGSIATSVLLPDFQVNVSDAFAAAGIEKI